jgi:parallel beta-helix repeat protein
MFFFLDDASAQTITVQTDGTGDYTSIRDAVNSAEPGDVVSVGSGEYYESQIVVQDQNLKIVGAGIDATYVNADSSILFRVYSEGVEINGFSINKDRDARAIHVDYNSEGVTVKNVKIYSTYNYAIYVDGGWFTLQNSIIGVDGYYQNSYGLYLNSQAQSAIIKNNEFNKNGIDVRSDNNQIQGNIITGTSDWSIRLYGQNNDLESNTVTDSPVNEDASADWESAFNTAVATRTETDIDFDVGSGSFVEGQDTDYFGAIWEGTFCVGDGCGTGGGNGSGGNYVYFNFYADDGYRLWIDNNLVINYPDCYGGVSRSYSNTMNDGYYAIKIEMAECTGNARAYLQWYNGNPPETFSATYYHSTTSAGATDFKSVYIGSTNNNVAASNAFEGSKFVLLNGDTASISGGNFGNKKISNLDYQINVYGATGGTISGVTLVYPGGIYIESSSGVTISNNILKGDLGININSGDDFEISGNTLLETANSDQDIRLSGVSNSLIERNEARSGVYVTGDSNQIGNNSVIFGSNLIHVSGQGNSVYYNTIYNSSGYAIQISGSNNVIAFNEVKESSGFAIYLNSDQNTVTETNDFKGSCVINYYGVERTKQTKKVISSCDGSADNIWNFNYLVGIRDSDWLSIEGLEITDIKQSTGISLSNSNNISLNNIKLFAYVQLENESFSRTGITVYNSDHISIANSELRNFESCIYASQSDDFEVESSKFRNCDIGIRLDQSTDAKLEGNTLRNSESGFFVSNAFFFNIEDNELRNDRTREMLGTGTGIQVSASSHGSVVNNVIAGFDISGLVYVSVSYMKTNNNEIYDNGVGIDIYSISSRTYLRINYNDIYDNHQYGIYSDGPIDARHNWWGHASGPYQRCESQEGCQGNVNIEGQGNPVNANVDASEQLYTSEGSFTGVDTLQMLRYEYKWVILGIIVLGIIGIVAARRMMNDDFEMPVTPLSQSRAAPSSTKLKTAKIQCPKCEAEIIASKKKGSQTITCSKCGTSGQIEL